MQFDYYYNNVPGIGQVRNNLVYTSLISRDKKIFVQWFTNDTEYHRGKNEIIDPELMEEKWLRELKHSELMRTRFKEDLLEVDDIDHREKKIFLKIQGNDFWQQHFDQKMSFDQLVPGWRSQMLGMFKNYRSLGLYKFSLHPSSYFIINGKLKSINYFFSYLGTESPPVLESHRSYISWERQAKLKKYMDTIGINWQTRLSFKDSQILCFESFKNDYPEGFIDEAKHIYDN